MNNILIVDDEKNMCKVLKLVFEKDGFHVEIAHNGASALEILTNKNIDLVVADLKMPDMDGIELLKKSNGYGLGVPFIVISAYGTITSAVEAMKLGAVDFVTKPFNKNLIRHRVSRIINRLSDYTSNRKHIPFLEKNRNHRKIIYESSAMREVMETVERIAGVPRPVMLLGESGSGKEMLANEIHSRYEHSKSLPFVSINCPALPETLFESELFGYRKGAFTGASSDYKGKLKMADGGTLFLDEIAELPISIQAKFLRFLEDRTFIPLGSTEEVQVNTRIICATNKELHSLVELGEFRKDLYYRLNTLVLRIPPLRERKEDIPPMVEFFNSRLSEELNTEAKDFSDEVIETFIRYPWPGNVRELKNIVERIFLMSGDRSIELRDVPEEILAPQSVSSSHTISHPVSASRSESRIKSNTHHSSDADGSSDSFDQMEDGEASDVIADTEKQMLKDALIATDWNLTRAAKKLGISRSAIRWRIHKYGLKKP